MDCVSGSVRHIEGKKREWPDKVKQQQTYPGLQVESKEISSLGSYSAKKRVCLWYIGYIQSLDTPQQGIKKK